MGGSSAIIHGREKYWYKFRGHDTFLEVVMSFRSPEFASSFFYFADHSCLQAAQR